LSTLLNISSRYCYRSQVHVDAHVFPQIHNLHTHTHTRSYVIHTYTFIAYTHTYCNVKNAYTQIELDRQKEEENTLLCFIFVMIVHRNYDMLDELLERKAE